MSARRKKRRREIPPRLRVVEKPDSAVSPRKGSPDEDLSYADLIEKLVAEEIHARARPKRPRRDRD